MESFCGGFWDGGSCADGLTGGLRDLGKAEG